MQFTIKQGMNQDILKSYPDNHFDSIVTDPPYGIEFLGKDWDSNTGAVETWQECFRVLKPGGHILAFSAARTYHYLATNIESVGFEIRDQLMWIYASGFPKAQDIGKAIQKRQGVKETKPSKGMNGYAEVKNKKGKEKWMNPGNITAEDYPDKKDEVIPTSPEAQAWSGWKTALKPAHEPIVMARKPFKGSCIDNVLEHGTGALNIDATRIGDEEITTVAKSNASAENTNNPHYYAERGGETPKVVKEITNTGRFPSNVFGEIPDYQKYFYCPKVSRGERHVGFEQTNIPTVKDMVEELGATISSDGQTVSIPGYSDIKVHGLKHEYEQLTKNKKGSLDHIATGNNFGDGLSTGVDIMTKAKGSLDHIATDPAGMFDHGTSYMAHKDANSIMSTEDMIEAMGGKLTGDNRVWTPDLGEFYIHGLKEEYRKWCKKNNKATGSMGNNHPTVKPVALMSYLVKLVTPEGGKVLDPFNGSGSTGMACVEHGFEYTGCELDPAYVAIATKRIQGWYNKTLPDNNFKELFDASK